MADRGTRRSAATARRGETGRRSGPIPATSQAKRAGDAFPVVAVGASAGGLNAFRKFVARIPADSGMAFVLIQHLDPTHESMMPDLLATHTRLAVLQAVDGMPVERDHIYTIPPGVYMTMSGGALRLAKPADRHGVRLPLDRFLRSMAEDMGERAVCVILSGAGTDGSLGLRAIKEHNGLVVVQDPVEAEHDGMPRSAVATDAVDRVLPVEEIADVLVDYGRGRRQEKARDRTAVPEADHDATIDTIIGLLRANTPHDFGLYKTGTLQRRIQRRVVMAGVGDMARYLELLKREPRELELLAKDLLINVTNFFRDPPVFEFLAEHGIPELVRRHRTDQPIRVWVAGCSTGEEPYSLAMLLFEELARTGRQAKIQVFASDVDADAIAVGREGVYPESIESDVTQARLDKFFTKEDHHYRVVPDLRAAVVFAVHDVLADPPFARLDLISCRNLLIYLTAEAQDRLLRLFHFSLRDSGRLLLGSSETAGRLADRFRAISKSQRLYERVGYLRPSEVDFPLGFGKSAEPPGSRGTINRPAPGTAIGETARNALLTAYAPPSALINGQHEVLYYLGQTDRYLRVVPGEPSRDILLLAREGLRSKLRIAVRQVAQQKVPATVRAEARMKRDGATVAVSVSVQPVASDGDTLYLVSFADLEPQIRKRPIVDGQAEDASRLAEVERELESTRGELQTALQELELWSDEQRSINEEAVSVNEESQATNEELMTSKEELQSLNEELAALNNQLQVALEAQRDTANDLQNILYSSDVATLFLDCDLNIRFFTPTAKSHFRIIASDVGRPLADLTPRTPDIALLADARTVLGHSIPMRSEIDAGDGAWFVRRITPYRTRDSRIEGVVVTFADISELKAAERRLEAARAYSDSIVNNIRRPLLVLDAELRIVSGNDAFYRCFAVAPDSVIGQPFAEVVHHIADQTGLLEFLGQVGAGGAPAEMTVEAELPPLGRRTLIVGAGLIDGEPAKLLLSIDDDTERRQIARALEEAKQQAEQANLAKSRFLAAASHDLRQPLQTLSLLHGLIGRKIKEPELVKLVTLMDATLGAMSGMLNTLLDINQLEAGMVRPEVVTFPIEELTLRLRTEFGYHAAANGLGLAVVPSSLHVRSDPHLLEQLLRNLLANAVKYTRHGKVLLGCRRRGDKLRIEVWDTGPGIPAEQMEAIFQEFHQIGNPARERSRGLGLGLAIVRRLSELLQHPVDVRSQVGRGSMFAVELPLGRPEDVLLRTRRRHEVTRSANRGGLALIVEDDPDVRDTMALVFANSGFTTIAAQDGAEANALCGSGNAIPDLLIVDYDLPGGRNGLQVVAGLHEQTGRAIPAVILTGDISTATSSAIGRRGFTRLVKPVKLDELMGVVGELMEARGAARSADGRATLEDAE